MKEVLVSVASVAKRIHEIYIPVYIYVYIWYGVDNF
jgi:hypothetical protein